MAGLRVCIVTSLVRRDRPPALVSFVAEQVAALTAAGCDVTVITPYDESGRLRGRLWCLRRVRTAARTGRFDVFHVHYGSILGCGAVLALRGRPTVLTVHGSDALGLTYASIRKPAVAMHLTLGVVLTQIAASLAGRTIAVSSRVRDGLLPWLRRRTAVVPCGVDFGRFSPGSRTDARRRLGLSERQFLVLFASPRRIGKNAPLASAAVTQAAAIDPRIALLLADDVRFDDMPDYVRAADVLLLTSHSEGSPVITKEALACNTPVVTVDVGDVAEQLAGVAGCAIVPRDAGAIAQTLVDLARRAAAINGRDRSTRYDNRTIARELVTMYTTLCTREQTAQRKPSWQEAR